MRPRNILIVAVFCLFACFLATGAGAANLKDAWSATTLKQFAGSEGAGYQTGDTSNIESMIGNIITVALSLLGVIFLVLMIYGGYMWMTAAGKEERVAAAQNIIRAAVIGLVIVVLAYAVSYFVIERLVKMNFQPK